MNEQQSVAQSTQVAASLAQKYGVELGPELSTELKSPTQYDQPQDNPGYTPNFYENDLWMNIKPQSQAKPVDTRPQQEIAYENYLAEKHKVEQIGEQAEQVQGQNAKLVTAHLEYGWEDSGFQQYLDSDDDAYTQVQLSPAQLQLAQEMWGLDEDTAKAYVYHHKLTPDDLAQIETSFTGKASPPPVAERVAPPSQKYDEDDADYSGYTPDSKPDSNPNPAAGYDSVAALDDDVNHIRRTYYPQATDAEWSGILNDCIDEFESLPQQDRDAYDSPAGLWALYQRVSYRRQQQQKQAQRQVQPQQDQNRQRAKRNTQGFNANALTPQGKLKQSWINSLSNVDYSNNADRITAWYARGLVDRNA